MNLFQLVFKQMRQRALGTWLTLLSVLLGVALAVSIFLMRDAGSALFGQTEFGYDVIIGPAKGSPLQLTLNTVYHLDVSPGVIPYQIYEDMARKTAPPPGRPDYRRYVKIAIPFMVGDSYKGRRIVGTSPQMFGFDDDGQRVKGEPFMYREGMSYDLAEGRAFGPRRFEAVLGSDVAATFHMHLYDDKLSQQENQKTGGAFQATHGFPGPNEKPDIHKPVWRVVGILKPTHTAGDRVLYIPFISLYAIAEHESGMIDQALLKHNIDPSKVPADRLDEVLVSLGFDPKKFPESARKKFKMSAPTTKRSSQDVGELLKDAAVAPVPETAAKEDEGPDPDVYKLDDHGDIVPDLPKEEWELSAIIVKSRGGISAEQILYNFKVIDDRATAANPASVMRSFFDTFFSSSTTVLLVIAAMVSIVAAIGILVSIYNSVAARNREIAILRALGATRTRILTLICVEAGLIGLFGGLLGLVAGHLLGGVGSYYMRMALGQGFAWMVTGYWEWLYLLGVVLIALLAGLVPAAKAYGTPVATNLTAS